MHRIICIDPDASRAEEPVAVLRSAGYEVMLAFSPEVGMALLRLFPPDLVLLDSALSEQLMPKISQACPTLPVIVTGEKPVSVEDLEWVARQKHAGIKARDAYHLSH